jgi:L-threonate 2-dehydrogenase
MSESKPVAVKVGVIGLGAMGSGVAQSLRRAGFSVFVCDARDGVAEKFAADGGTACDTPATVAEQCNVIVSLVINAEQTEQVLFGHGGCAGTMRPGSVFVMCSTVDPNWSADIEHRLGTLDLLYLDCPVSGGPARAATGELTLMAAGRPEAFAKCDGILDGMAARIYKLSEKAGIGSKVKLINNLLCGIHGVAAAEAMALGLREGVDPTLLYDVIVHSAGNSWMFQDRMAHVLAGDYTPLSAVDIFVKDLGLVLDMARSSKFPLPMASAAHQLFLHASAKGFAKEDDCAVIKVYPSIELPKAKVQGDD